MPAARADSAIRLPADSLIVKDENFQAHLPAPVELELDLATA